ncbi:MAG: dihydroxyacetone kinase subunit DhaK, partial [Chloroflexota bacterium]
ISGGGSGHEPLHGGFVGPGMLTAACPGAIFTAPTGDQIYAATLAANSGAGVLHIVKNYTGDRLNFEMGAELARDEGVEVETVIVNDDVAVEDSLYTAGRRGTGLTVMVEKIAGAAAEQGRPLAEVAEIARRVNANGRSMGMALSSGIVPHIGTPNFELSPDEIELGIGIHGEPGRKRLPMTNAAGVTHLLLQPILNDLPFQPGEQVLVFVNGLGGTPLVELYVMFGELIKALKTKEIAVTRSLVGSYVTSLEMAGCSFTLLKLDEELTELWDAPVKTPTLTW